MVLVRSPIFTNILLSPNCFQYWDSKMFAKYRDFTSTIISSEKKLPLRTIRKYVTFAWIMNYRMITSWKHCKQGRHGKFLADKIATVVALYLTPMAALANTFDFFHVAKKFPRCKNWMNLTLMNQSLRKLSESMLLAWIMNNGIVTSCKHANILTVHVAKKFRRCKNLTDAHESIIKETKF